jgi:hypothetical protein
MYESVYVLSNCLLLLLLGVAGIICIKRELRVAPRFWLDENFYVAFLKKCVF